MNKDADPKVTGLQEKLKEYEEKFLPAAPAAAHVLFHDIHARLDEILSTHQSPYLHRGLRLPLILIATPEIVSLPNNMGNLANVVSTGDGGGLADISAALVTELDRQGVNVHVALPEYQHLFEGFADISHQDYEMLKENIDDMNRVHLIEDGMFTDAHRVYNDAQSGLDKIDLRRSTAFMRGIIFRLFPMLRRHNKHILVHCNDWMTGLIPAAARGAGIRSLMTFHNIFTQYQWPKGLQKHGINLDTFWQYLYFRDHPDKFGSYEANYERNDVDFMTTGLYAADFINTVSPTFLKEIVEGYFVDHHIIPDSMREIIRKRDREHAALGILNAPALTADPRLDPMLVQKYSYGDIENEEIVGLEVGKQRNKEYFQKEVGLVVDNSVPLFFWPSRIARPQKGFELLLDIIPYLMDKFPMQIAVVANGEPDLIGRIQHLQYVFPGRVSHRSFTRKLNQIGKAASDFLLMPSLYEPCGIPQVEAPRYGTFPIVRRTGGLADTVDMLSGNGLIGNGFLFQDFMPSGLWYAITRALSFYKRDKSFRTAVQKRIMKESFEKFNIQNTARRYIQVYEQVFRREDPGLKII
ncbi:MAG: glycogen/starch synthase [Fibrobacterota bacterium]